MENKDKPAFPIIFNSGQHDQLTEFGITKREHFAAMAMQGILSRAGNWDNVKDYGFIYRESIRHADELLKQLDNGKNG